MSNASDFKTLSPEKRRRIEEEINGKLKDMGRLRDFFGSGHGVDVVGMISSWIEREVGAHEARLGVKLTYTLETMPDGTCRIILTDTVENGNR